MCLFNAGMGSPKKDWFILFENDFYYGLVAAASE